MRTIKDDLVLHKGAYGPMIHAPVYVLTNVLDDINDVGKSLEDQFSTPDTFFEDTWREIHKCFWIEWSEKRSEKSKQTFAFSVLKVPDLSTRPWAWEICGFYRRPNTIHRNCVYVSGDPKDGFSYVQTTAGAAILNIVSGKIKNARILKEEEEKWRQLAFSGVLHALCLMQLMSSKNVKFETIEPTPKEFKAIRRKKGKGIKRKPSSYRILKIGDLPPQLAKASEEKGEGSKKRRHQVRGHFRTYKHQCYKPETRGTYWIRPHWRGDEKLGIIDSPIVLRKVKK